MAPVKIIGVELENVKRVALVHLEPSPKGLTVIGGANRQGKTSILDAICYALGGEKRRPSNLQREGGSADARIELRLSNGLRVERKGKNAALKVTDPAGQKGGQKLLDAFVEELALDLPKFLAMSGKDKAGVLLRILGIGDQLAVLDREERVAYEERTAQGRVADQKEKYATELPEHHDVPDAPLTVAELVAQSREVMARNAERQAARRRLEQLKADVGAAERRVAEARAMLANAEDELAKRKAMLAEVASAPVGVDEDTAELERRMADAEIVNAKVRANLEKRRALGDAEQCREEYGRLTAKVEDIRARRQSLLDGAEMPLPRLSVDGGELTYDGKAWDCMSGVEKVRAGVAIVRKLKPECGFVLLDELEKFDLDELRALGEWLEAQDLQAIATRVSTGAECTLLIEDGQVAGQEQTKEQELEY
jgi:DNA repair exonuclease SbcCD ATPase subunit